MTMLRFAALAAAAACGNSLPPPGTCDLATSGEPTVESVALGGPAGYDDLAFSHALGKVVAAPEGTGRVYLVDPDSLAITPIGVPAGTASADASATTVFVADRGAGRIVGFDIASAAMTASHSIAGEPDYVRVAPTTGEVWLTVPGRNRIDILEPAGLAAVGSITTAGPPEGLTFDASGRAYVNNDGAVVAIDVARRVVVGEWDVGCGYSHGFPQVDLDYGLAIGGCRASGGAGVTTMTGEQRAGFEAGGDAAVLAYDVARHHLYLRGDPGATLSILAVCSSGELSELARVAIPMRGHAAAADDRGHVWIADATTGGLVRVTDPFAGTQ
jgi:DNA-binding beta-propeller fold protein YncE